MCNVYTYYMRIVESFYTQITNKCDLNPKDSLHKMHFHFHTKWEHKNKMNFALCVCIMCMSLILSVCFENKKSVNKSDV